MGTLLTEIIQKAKGAFDLEHFVVANPRSKHQTNLDPKKFSQLISDVMHYIDTANNEFDDPLEATIEPNQEYAKPTPRYIDFNEGNIEFHVEQPDYRNNPLSDLERDYTHMISGFSSYNPLQSTIGQSIAYQAIRIGSKISVEELHEDFNHYKLSISTQ